MPIKLKTPETITGKIVVILASVGMTLFAVLLVANFSSGEKRVRAGRAS